MPVTSALENGVNSDAMTVATVDAAYPPAAAGHSRYYLVTYYLIDSSCGPTVNPSVVQSVQTSTKSTSRGDTKTTVAKIETKLIESKVRYHTHVVGRPTVVIDIVTFSA